MSGCKVDIESPVRPQTLDAALVCENGSSEPSDERAVVVVALIGIRPPDERVEQ
jgi:hypothetical protein